MCTPSRPPPHTFAQQSGLTERGFEVLRLNTYDTLPVSQLDEDKLAAAKQAAVVTVGSPSAIK
jgi:uroporphyrinogen-III synthase